MKSATTILTAGRDDLQKLHNSRLTIQHRPIDTLRLDPLNPREHSQKQIAQIAESIRAFGFNAPVLIDDDNKIIAGHGRVLACKLLDMAEIPTICLAHLSPEQIRAFVIADNKLTENSTWNEILLREQLKFLSEIELTFSLEATGFEMGEIDVLIEGVSRSGDVEQDPADIMLGQSEVSISSPGDCWQLGKHRVLCGDALDQGSYDRLMNRQLATVVFADPGLGKKQHCDFAIAYAELNQAAVTDFLGTLCKRLVTASRDGSIHFICIDWHHVGELLDAGKEMYDEVKNICVWVKDNAAVGSLYRSQHGFILVFKRRRRSHRKNVQRKQFGRYRSDVWQYPSADSFSRATAQGNLPDFDPTVKPVALVADAILDCSARGDVVLDPFLGSGTTVIAAERTGRICYGIEMGPANVDTTVRRWQRFTGMRAVHGDSGRSFDELQKEASDARKR